MHIYMYTVAPGGGLRLKWYNARAPRAWEWEPRPINTVQYSKRIQQKPGSGSPSPNPALY